MTPKNVAFCSVFINNLMNEGYGTLP